MINLGRSLPPWLFCNLGYSTSALALTTTVTPTLSLSTTPTAAPSHLRTFIPPGPHLARHDVALDNALIDAGQTLLLGVRAPQPVGRHRHAPHLDIEMGGGVRTTMLGERAGMGGGMPLAWGMGCM